MQKYFYFWLFFIVISATLHGYKNYKGNIDMGYDKIHFEETGKIVEFHGGLKEAVSCTIAASLGLLFSPIFLIIETVKFIPAAIVLHYIS